MRVLTITLAVLGLTGVAAPASALALGSGQGCAAPCITTAWITPYHRAFDVQVKTNTPARISVSVAKRLPPGNGGGLATSVYLDSAASPAGRKSFSPHLTGLEPDRLYEITVAARDAEGRVDRRSTTWRTRSLETIGEGGPASFDSGAGCAAQCIQTATASPGGTGAQLNVKTTVPAKLSIQADRDAPGTVGGMPFFGTPEAEVKTGQLRTQWTGALDGLKPGSRYHVIVRATDAQGRLAARHGVFETDERHARIVFTWLHVTSDADKGRNRGELRFSFGVEDVVRLHRGEHKIKSGSWVKLSGYDVTLPGAPRNLDLAVQGTERDNRGCIAFHSEGAGFRTPDSGKKKATCDKWTWSTARGRLDLDAPVAGGGSLLPGYGGSGMHNFVLAQGRGELRFDAHGYVDVWYG